MAKAKKRTRKKTDREEIEKIEQIPQVEPESEFGEILAAWQFPEFVKHDRSKKWYIYFVVIFAILLILSLISADLTFFRLAETSFGLSLSQSPLFAIFLIIALIFYIIGERKEPLTMQVFLTEDGVLLHGKFIPYEDFDDFYIIYYPPEIKNLYLQPKNTFKPLITLPLENESPVAIRSILLQYLPEDLEKEEIPTSEGVSQRFKF